MDEFKLRAGEKFEAFHEAAKTAAGSSKSQIQDVLNQTIEAIKKIRESFHAVWHHELIAEGRARVSAWARDAVQRVREGTPPLSPVLLYEELVALFKDRVWRRSVVIFACGAALGGGVGLALGARAAARPPAGPHARALHVHADHTVTLVEDALTPAAGAGEVLVRVQAFSVCVADRGVVRGRGAALRALVARAHTSLGRGFAGVVLDVGHGVSELELGDEVWGCVSEWAGGAASELLTIRSTRVSKRPRALAADAAAALPWAGALALAALDRLHFTPDTCKGKRVVVCGASSGEGCVLVQLLGGWRARVAAATTRHHALTLRDLGAQEFVDMEVNHSGASWATLEQYAARAGPWDAVLVCAGPGAPPDAPRNLPALLKASAARGAVAELRPRALLSDRLPLPFSLVFAAGFCTYRILRWCVGYGMHTDWLEDKYRLTAGLETLAKMVDCGQVVPMLDKVYHPQDFEAALAHACSDDAMGTTVIRFP